MAAAIFAAIHDGSAGQSGFDRRLNWYIRNAPLHSYPASDSPIHDFNRNYDESFVSTRTINYKGDKCLFLAFRLDQHMKKRSPSLTIRLLLPDPGKISLFVNRAETLQNTRRYRDSDRDEISRKIRVELMAGLMALVDMKDHYRFEVRFFDETVFLRYEILDAVLVMSILPMQEEGYYPPTLIYDRQSLFYSSFLTNFSQTWNVAGSNVLDNSNATADTIETLLTGAKVETTVDELRRVYQDYFRKVQ